jgi:histidinol-phosphate aminotransferase
MSFANPGVLALQPYKVGKPLSELEREYGVRDAVKLASNENPLGPSPHVLDVIRGTLQDIGRYPDGNGFDLKAALSSHLGVAPECLTLGNGSNDVLELVGRAFLSPGREAVFSEYAFIIYPLMVQASGAVARVAPAHDGSRGPLLGHDLDAMAAAITDETRVVLIANPNNPTGTWLPGDALKAFIEQLPGHLVVVVDEAYFEYVDKPEYPDTVQWIDAFPNLLVTRTFSKAYGLASLRVGYGVSQPALADLLNRVRQPFNVNGPALAAAVAALNDTAHVERSARLNQEEMARLESGFRQLGLDFVPSAGNFLLLDLGRRAAPVYEALLREGVIVRPVDNYGLPDHLRVSIGAPEENQRLLQALARVTA